MNVKLSIVLVLVSAPLLYFASKYAQELTFSSNQNATILQTDECDFGNEICTATYKKQLISISSSNGLTTREPMKIRVDMPEVIVKEFSNVQLLLQGKTMYMGIVHMDLQQVGGAWVGELYLPFCTTQQMDWLLHVNFTDHAGGRYQASVAFQVAHY